MGLPLIDVSNSFHLIMHRSGRPKMADIKAVIRAKLQAIGVHAASVTPFKAPIYHMVLHGVSDILFLTLKYMLITINNQNLVHILLIKIDQIKNENV